MAKIRFPRYRARGPNMGRVRTSGLPSNASVSSAEMRLISSGAEGSFGRLAMRPIIVPSMAGLGTRGGSPILGRNGTNAYPK
jgi:hypothetical protein